MCVFSFFFGIFSAIRQHEMLNYFCVSIDAYVCVLLFEFALNFDELGAAMSLEFI